MAVFDALPDDIVQLVCVLAPDALVALLCSAKKYAAPCYAAVPEAIAQRLCCPIAQRHGLSLSPSRYSDVRCAWLASAPRVDLLLPTPLERRGLATRARRCCSSTRAEETWFSSTRLHFRFRRNAVAAEYKHAFPLVGLSEYGGVWAEMFDGRGAWMRAVVLERYRRRGRPVYEPDGLFARAVGGESVFTFGEWIGLSRGELWRGRLDNATLERWRFPATVRIMVASPGMEPECL